MNTYRMFPLYMKIGRKTLFKKIEEFLVSNKSHFLFEFIEIEAQYFKMNFSRHKSYPYSIITEKFSENELAQVL